MSRHRGETSRRGLGAALSILLGLALLAGAAFWGYWAFLRSDSEDGGASCDRDAITIAVTPELQAPVNEAAKALAKRGTSCVTLDVTAASSATVASGGLGELPGLWIPDATAWLARTATNVPDAVPVSASVASSPVLLVSGREVPAPSSWLAALASGSVAVTDPLTSSAGAAALLSVQAERTVTGATDEQVGGVIVPAAQNYGAQPEPITDDAAAFAAVSATGSQVQVVATEQAFLDYVGEHSGTSVVAIAPETGALSLDYPIAAIRDDAATREAGEALASFLGTAEGAKLLDEASLRSPAGDELSSGVGVGTVPRLVPPQDEEVVAQTLRTWGVLTVPSRLLAVFDVSGSMDEAVGDGTRMSLTVAAAQAGLAMFSKSASIGAWAFSDETIGSGGRPYRPLAKIRGLEDPFGAGTQRDHMRAALQGLPEITTGGTALYDTTLAAIREVRSSYDPEAVNSVVLFTDGAEDGSSSITKDELLSTLKREYDPAAPINLILIGISEDADEQALEQMAEAAHGRYYVAEDPADIQAVFIQSFLAR
jgi:hypothetical protein